MASFLFYDIVFFILFSLAVTIFLIKHKKALSREGIIFMYRTKLGMKAIDYFGVKHRKLLKKLVPVVIILGFLLMAAILWVIGQTLMIYIIHPEITKVIKAPPVAPLIPYFPRLFGMQSFFPNFYFTYFIVALAIVAIVHEFSHGIYMRVFNIKIKSTGIVFLGPILGAFVEEEKSQFEKKKNHEQMAVLGAGVFANILTGILFYLLYVAFFYLSFQPAGYSFNAYGTAIIPTSNITSIQKIPNSNLTEITANNKTYYLDKLLKKQLEMNLTKMAVYLDSPAFKNQIKGPIIQIDNTKIKNYKDLKSFLERKKPGDKITLITLENEKPKKYNITLAEHPQNKTKAYLGVGHYKYAAKGIIRKTLAFFMSFKEQSTYYAPTWDGEFAKFIYDMLWWIMLINFLVALFNMLPVGILDGGRFFYLAVLSVTKSKKVASIAFKLSNKIILLAFLLMMLFWFIGII